MNAPSKLGRSGDAGCRPPRRAAAATSACSRLLRHAVLLAAAAAAAVLAAGLAPAAVRSGAAPAAAPHPAFVPPRAEALVAGEIDQARLQRLVRELVRLGPRMGGTPSGDRAAAAIAADFVASGLASRTLEDPPQPAHWEDAWSVELVPGGPVASAWPYGFSPSVGPAAAPLVVAGDPAELKTAPPARWRGKIVYVPGDVLGAYRRLAAAADRPLAILTSAPNDGLRYLDAALVAPLPAMPAGGGRPLPVFAVSYQDGRRLAAAAGVAGATVRVMLRSTVREGSPRTVVADIAGRDGRERDRYYLVCAHGDSDSGGPGADDNGSGEAVVMELARVLAGLVRGGRLPAPRVTLRFAVWGSEYASSGAYVAREGDRLRRCLGVINLDEVGTGAERNAVYFESNEVPWNRELLRAFDRVGADYAGRPGFWPEYTTNPSQGGTDSYAFLPRRYKGELTSDLRIPATTVYTAAWDHPGHLRQTPGWESPATPDPVHLTIDYSRYYHSSGDTPGNTTDRKPEAMVRAARAIAIALLRLAFQAPS
ncbi:MAG TPA: M28 family peptidase [Thermoanaerobaculia bacterium]|nr:M28 family peptidase [Thermoanaerobaculia bacterium]